MKQTLRLLAETADSVSDGDIVERMIRSASQWGLLPVQVGGLCSFSSSSLCVCVCVCVWVWGCASFLFFFCHCQCVCECMYIFAQFILLTHAHRTLLLYNCNVSNSTPLNVFQSSKNFNLTLPSPSLHQAIFSSVLPGQLMRGGMGRPEFPRWLGNHSARGKNDRLLQELQRHTRLR